LLMSFLSSMELYSAKKSLSVSGKAILKASLRIGFLKKFLTTLFLTLYMNSDRVENSFGFTFVF